MYMGIKHAHMMFAVISGLFFLVRGVWMLLESPMLQKKWVKILPHVNDTLMLAFAAGLVVMSQQYPFVDHWLSAKLIALVLYVVIGTVAIKRGKTKSIRAGAFVVALLLYAYIVGVAITHNPLSFMS